MNFCDLDNRNLGMNMKVEKIGVDRIKAKLDGLKNQKEKKVENFGLLYSKNF